jgi:hypothetical protein
MYGKLLVSYKSQNIPIAQLSKSCIVAITITIYFPKNAFPFERKKDVPSYSRRVARTKDAMELLVGILIAPSYLS